MTGRIYYRLQFTNCSHSVNDTADGISSDFAVRRKIDLELVNKTLGSFVNSLWKKNKRVILDTRGKHPDPYAAEYFQCIAEQIYKRMNKNKQQPFYLSSKEKFKIT